MKLKYHIISNYLLFTIALVMTNEDLIAQNVNSATLQEIDQSDGDTTEERGTDYYESVSNDYLRKFGQVAEKLKRDEDELASLQLRKAAVIERSKKISSNEQRDLFKENIKTLKKEESNLITKIRSSKMALSLLQENMDHPAAEKKKVLDELEGTPSRLESVTTKNQARKKIKGGEKIEIDHNEVYLNPPAANCKLVFNGIDQVTKKTKREVERQFLFGYSHPKLKIHFKDKHFLSCDVKIIKHSKNNYLWLYITIASKDAQRTYGRIEQKSTLKFELLNGEILYLQSAQNANGVLEAYTGNTNYEVVLPLDKSQAKQLMKSEVDRVGIMWTSGYEQYEIYNIDLIMNQLNCVNQK